MSETQAEQHVNGTAPTAPPADKVAPCEDCATPMEKILGILCIVVAAGITLMAIDMITGGRVGGWARTAVQEATQ